MKQLFVVSAALSLALASNPSVSSAQTQDAHRIHRAELRKYRIANGLDPFTRNPPLGRAAQSYAFFLAQNNLDGHEADGKNPGVRIREAGYTACVWAENVHSQWYSQPINFQTAALRALDWWKGSPGHNANLLHNKAKEYGFGISYRQHGNQHIYKSVQVFAAPC